MSQFQLAASQKLTIGLNSPFNAKSFNTLILKMMIGFNECRAYVQQHTWMFIHENESSDQNLEPKSETPFAIRIRPRRKMTTLNTFDE